MEPLLPNEDFTSDDAANWRAFLATRTGQRLIPKVIDSIPGLLAGGGVNEILIRNGEARGFTAAVQAFLSCANPEPEHKPEPSAYVSLTDDKAWNDGQSLTDPQ